MNLYEKWNEKIYTLELISIYNKRAGSSVLQNKETINSIFHHSIFTNWK